MKAMAQPAEPQVAMKEWLQMIKSQSRCRDSVNEETRTRRSGDTYESGNVSRTRRMQSLHWAIGRRVNARPGCFLQPARVSKDSLALGLCAVPFMLRV